MPYRPAKLLTLWAVGLLYASAATEFLLGLIEAIILVAFPKYYDNDFTRPYAPGEEELWMVHVGVSAIALLVLVGTAIAFCMWLYRAAVNTRALGARGMSYSPGWAVGSFFVPILNLFRPYQATVEIEKASNPQAAADNWDMKPGSGKVGIWWAFWILSSVLSIFANQTTGTSDTDTLMLSSVLTIAASACNIAAAFAAVSVIHTINGLQAEKYRSNPGASPAYCAECGYDLRGTPGIYCPECGDTIPGKSDEQQATFLEEDTWPQ